MEFQLSIHEHPLMYYEHEKKGDSRVNCYGCLQPLSGATYDCQKCDFIIHKSCGELPSQIIHFLHPKHPLMLFSKNPYGDGRGNSPICNYCKTMIWGFIYHCSLCKYDLDVKCVLLREIVKHEGHQHSFTLLRPMSFTCDECGETSKDMSYLCTTCQLSLHKHCASLGQSSNPTEYKSDDFASRVGDDIASRDEDDIDPITIGVDMLPEIKHSSHAHSLTLKNDEPLPDEICDACVRPLSAPFYKCDPCNFFLHSSCARLKTTITTLLHPHPLTLLCEEDLHWRFFHCAVCQIICNGFAYVCKVCSFIIDIRCASISTATLKHGGHEHILTLDQRVSEAICNACRTGCHYAKFRCEDCDFNLDLRCAMLPLNARHRWDEKHPLKLTFRNFERIPGQYFCNICEGQRYTKIWYYNCLECDLEVHPSCLFGRNDIKFGATIENERYHEHKLTFLEKSRFHARCKTSCDHEGKFVFECLTCNYHFHFFIYENYDNTKKIWTIKMKSGNVNDWDGAVINPK